MTTDEVTRTEAKRRTRGSVWFDAFVVLLALGYAFFFGFLIIGDAGFSSEEMVHTLAALAFTAALLVGLATQLVRPVDHIAGFWQVVAGILAVMVVAAIVGNPNNVGGQAGVFDWTYLIFFLPLFLLLALHPAGRMLFRGGSPNLLLLALVLVAAVPLVLYGIDQALIQRNSWPPKSDPHHNAHWFTMAELAFAIVLVGLVAALGIRGWTVAAWAAGGMAVVFGVSSAVWSDAASSAGVLSGVVAAAGGASFLAIALGASASRRRPRA